MGQSNVLICENDLPKPSIGKEQTKKLADYEDTTTKIHGVARNISTNPPPPHHSK